MYICANVYVKVKGHSEVAVMQSQAKFQSKQTNDNRQQSKQ